MTSIAEILARVPGVGTSSPMSAEEYADRRAKWANEETGSLTGIDCPDCRNKGYIMERRGTELISMECRCMARRRSVRNMEKRGLKDLLERYTFDRYQTPDKLYQSAKQKALNFLADYDGKWFMASGNPGSGKTHLCTAICGELLNAGLEVRYMLWRESAVQIKAAVNDPEAYARLVDPLKRVPVLYIDDFFKAAKITTGDINLAFELLNTRYNTKKLITVISSELSIEQILDIDEAVGSRIYERSKGYGYPVEAGRAQNYGEQPDISGLPGVHIECKRAEALRLSEWMAQAERDAKRFQDGRAAVFHRRNRSPWLVTMRLEDWTDLYAASKWAVTGDYGRSEPPERKEM